MTFVLGSRSRAALESVHPDLIRTVHLAITTSEQDFAVTCGCRTLAQQKICVANGTSWTLNSKHRVQADGYGHAVDLVPFVDGQLSWDWSRCFAIASAMSHASLEAGLPLVWGGVWDRAMNMFEPTPGAIRQANADYVTRRRHKGLRAVVDGPHYELVL